MAITKPETTEETKPTKKVPDFLKGADQDTIDEYFEYSEFYKKRLAEINKNPGQMIMPPPNPKTYILNKGFFDAARPKDGDKKTSNNAKGGLMRKAKGGLAEATARLRAQELSAGGTVIKTKTVAIDKSPNSGLITQRGFGASRKT